MYRPFLYNFAPLFRIYAALGGMRLGSGLAESCNV